MVHPSQMSTSAGVAAGRGSQALLSRLQRGGAGQFMCTEEMSADVCLSQGGSPGFPGSQFYHLLLLLDQVLLCLRLLQ